MNNLGIDVLMPGILKDITLSANIQVKGNSYKVGFASGGDTPKIVQRNIDFFKPLNLDHMVFACRSQGAGLSLLQAYASSLGVTPIIIPTKSQPSTYDAAVANTAKTIVSNIP